MTTSNLIDQYWQIKNQHKDALLFFRLGDFYELFDEDAIIASKALDIVLTKRQQTTPMCGVPVHSHEIYLQKLIRLGHKVAICEQVEKPSANQKGPLKREVVRILTPGTLIEDSLLQQKDPHYLCVISKEIKANITVALCDLSSGCLILEESTVDKIQNILQSYQPKEILIAQSVYIKLPLKNATPISDSKFDLTNTTNHIKKYFAVNTPEIMGIKNQTQIIAAGALIDYLYLTHKKDICLIRRIINTTNRNYLGIDKSTWKNLELTETYGGKCEGSLFHTLNNTITASGHRLLLRRLQMPLIDKNHINKRLDHVEYFKKIDVLDTLKIFPDVERILTRLCVSSKLISRELAGILNGLVVFEKLKEHELFKFIDLSELRDLLTRAIDEDQTIKPGFSSELDSHRIWHNQSANIIKSLEDKYREQTGITSLKIKDNNVWGYFIEITPVHKNKVPDYFIHKQTLSTSLRYITDELIDAQNRIYEASEKIISVENGILDSLRQKVLEYTKEIQENIHLVASIDVAQSLAKLAQKMNYVRPEFSDYPDIRIINGRHPVIEQTADHFTANDCILDDSQHFYMITGPNMGGKSTFMRQNALIIIMAQMGSYVPAEKATLGLFKKIMSRVGSSDDISEGHSTFMVEMMETASILHQADEQTFVIVDEIGRGTSTEDGLAIAKAVTDHLVEYNKCKTLFATHYHQLTELKHEKIVQKTIEIKEWEDKIIFLHKIIDGAAEKSYGIHVAKLAGLPLLAIEKASQYLSDHPAKETHLKPQLALFESVYIESLIEKEIQQIELDNISPREAYSLLEKWQKKMRKKEAC